MIVLRTRNLQAPSRATHRISTFVKGIRPGRPRTFVGNPACSRECIPAHRMEKELERTRPPSPTPHQPPIHLLLPHKQIPRGRISCANFPRGLCHILVRVGEDDLRLNYRLLTEVSIKTIAIYPVSGGR